MPENFTNCEELERALLPARVGQRITIVRRSGQEPRRYIRTFCGNRWGWVNQETLNTRCYGARG